MGRALWNAFMRRACLLYRDKMPSIDGVIAGATHGSFTTGVLTHEQALSLHVGSCGDGSERQLANRVLEQDFTCASSAWLFPVTKESTSSSPSWSSCRACKDQVQQACTRYMIYHGMIRQDSTSMATKYPWGLFNPRLVYLDWPLLWASWVSIDRCLWRGR